MRRVCTIAFAFSLWSHSGFAQTESARGAARELGSQGVADFQAGSYAAAVSKLERAYSVVHAPSLGLWSARALAKSGKLVEAAERYLEVTRLRELSGEITVQKKAQAEAESERGELLEHIPNVTLEVPGHSAALKVTLDGVDIPVALLSAAMPVNPGEHRVEARDGERSAEQTFTASEGRTSSVSLQLSGASAPVPVAPASEARAPASSSSSSTATEQPAPAAAHHRGSTLTWVAFGAGAAGLIVGGVTGGLAASKRSSLDCANDKCPPSKSSDVDSYNGLRTISTIGFIVGGVGLATGGILLLSSGSSHESARAPSAPKVQAWVGLAAAGVSGAF